MAQSRTLRNVTIVELDKEYDALDRRRFDAAAAIVLTSAQRAQPPQLVLDLSRTEYIGSAFLDVLLRTHKCMEERGGRLVLAGVQPFCADVLRAAQLDGLWESRTTVEDAVRAAEGN